MKPLFLLSVFIITCNIQAQTSESEHKNSVSDFYTNSDSLTSPEYFFRKFIDNSLGGDLNNAELNLTKAIYLAPEISYFYFFRGQVRLDLGRTEMATKDLKRSIELFSGKDSIVMVYDKPYNVILQNYLNHKEDNSAVGKKRLLFFGTCSYLIGDTDNACTSWEVAEDNNIKEVEKLLTAYCDN